MYINLVFYYIQIFVSYYFLTCKNMFAVVQKVQIVIGAERHSIPYIAMTVLQSQIFHVPITLIVFQYVRWRE